MEHPFLMVISEDPWQSRLLKSLLQWSCHYLFKRLRPVAVGIQTPNLPHENGMVIHLYKHVHVLTLLELILDVLEKDYFLQRLQNEMFLKNRNEIITIKRFKKRIIVVYTHVFALMNFENSASPFSAC